MGNECLTPAVGQFVVACPSNHGSAWLNGARALVLRRWPHQKADALDPVVEVLLVAGPEAGRFLHFRRPHLITARRPASA